MTFVERLRTLDGVVPPAREVAREPVQAHRLGLVAPPPCASTFGAAAPGRPRSRGGRRGALDGSRASRGVEKNANAGPAGRPSRILSGGSGRLGGAGNPGRTSRVCREACLVLRTTTGHDGHRGAGPAAPPWRQRVGGGRSRRPVAGATRTRACRAGTMALTPQPELWIVERVRTVRACAHQAPDRNFHGPVGPRSPRIARERDPLHAQATGQLPATRSRGRALIASSANLAFAPRGLPQTQEKRTRCAESFSQESSALSLSSRSPSPSGPVTK